MDVKKQITLSLSSNEVQMLSDLLEYARQRMEEIKAFQGITDQKVFQDTQNFLAEMFDAL